MAQSRQRPEAGASDPAATLTADEQAQLDAMQQDDTAADVGQADAAATQQRPDADAGGTPAAADAGAADPATQPQRPQTVPHAAFHEERERRKAAEQTIAELKRSQQTLEERTNLLLQRIGQPQAQPQSQQAPALPTLEENPAAHIVGLLQQQGQRQDELTRWALQQEQARQTQANVAAIQERAVAMEREFIAQTPDYAQAVDHLANQRRLELAEAGYTDAAEREVILRNEALQLAQRALQSGRNPAEMLYGVAKVRGWKATEAATAQAEQPATAATNGQQRIDTVRAGQQQARSLGATRGAGPTPLTAQRLIEMSDADFLKMMDTPEGRDLMGA
jgi:hypothetical protein